MANTEFGTNAPQTVKRWANGLMRETFGKMDITRLMGDGPEACIQIIKDLDKNPGDRVVYDLLVQDRSPGVNGDEDLTGHETPLTFFQDTLLINQKRHAHRFMNMTQQRTVHDLRKAGRGSLSNWWAWFIEASFFAHAAGVTGDGEETVNMALGASTGEADFAGNTVTALDSGHLVDNSGSDFDIGMFDRAIAKAKVLNPRMAPIMVGGQPKYIAYLHPYQIRSLKADSATNGWNQIHQNAAVRSADNPIFSGAHGEYNGVIIRESEFIPRVGDVTHGVMLGQGALAIAFGNAWEKTSRAAAGGGTFFDWREEEKDYKNKKGIAGISILGLKRCQFNSKAYGVMGLRSTESAPV